MKINETEKIVELTERNLRALLAKLEGHPPDSPCTLEKWSDQLNIWQVKAVPDEAHYSDRLPGEVHKETIAHMNTL